MSAGDWRNALTEQLIYARHVLGLLRPGRRVPDYEAHPVAPRLLSGWQHADLETMVEEGRRQSDRQHEDLERVRGRAQFLLTLGLALLAGVAALRSPIARADHWWLWTLWGVSLAAGAWAALGAAAVSAVRADVEIVDAAVLSGYEPPVRRHLAADYADLVRAGENAIATRLTNFRVAVLWLLIAAALGLATWLWSAAGNSPAEHQPSSSTVTIAPNIHLAGPTFQLGQSQTGEGTRTVALGLFGGLITAVGTVAELRGLLNPLLSALAKAHITFSIAPHFDLGGLTIKSVSGAPVRGPPGPRGKRGSHGPRGRRGPQGPRGKPGDRDRPDG
jgi:hypothetical protein